MANLDGYHRYISIKQASSFELCTHASPHVVSSSSFFFSNLHAGLPFLSEGESNNSSIPINLETGLLSLIRKIICLLPDSRVKQVLGPILDQESIVVMANNSSVLVRTAVVRVSQATTLLHTFFY